MNNEIEGFGVSPLAQAAGGGSSTQDQAFQQMLDVGKKKQSYLEQQQAAYNADMENYANLVKQTQQPGYGDRGRWGAIAGALGRVEPTVGNIGQAYAGAGAAASGYDQAMQNDILKQQRELTLARQVEVRALESKGQNALLMKNLSGTRANWIQYKDDAGNTHLMDKTQGPGTEVVIPASQNSAWMKLLSQGQEIALKQDEEDKPQFALDYAMRMMKTLQPGKASVQAAQPATVDVGSGASQPATAEAPPPASGVSTSIDQGALEQLTPADQATALRLISRVSANPASAPNDRRELEKILAKYNAPDSSMATPANSIAAAAGRKIEAEEQAKLKTAQQMKSEEAQGSNKGKQIAEAPEKKTVLENYLAEADITQKTVQDLLSHPGLSKSTGAEGLVPLRGRVLTMSGSDAANFQADLKKLASRVTSLALQNARVGSAAGATGFGALDAGEREMLRDSMASLSLEQDPATLRKSLDTILGIISNSKNLASQGYARTYGAAPDDADAEYNAWKAKKGAK